ncbi:MAG: hypothetical protein JXB00_17430, partial [Bacteroidales bacterium]|nr:hypothetical protein [Bacteroidales bacterium]
MITTIFASVFLILFRNFRMKKITTLFIAVFSLSISLLAQNSPLPWEREIPLKEAAKSVFLTSTLAPDNSLPNRRCYPRDGKAMTINNLKMRTTLWGPPEQITISLTKNNVWDRRVNPRGLVAPTLQEIVDGV